MHLSKTLKSHLIMSTFLFMTLLPGIITFAHAPHARIDAGIFDGKTQRLYESGFDDSFPLRTLFRQSWTALKFGLLNEVSEGAVLGNNSVLFTAEEFTAPEVDQDFATALFKASQQIKALGAELVPVIVPDKARMLPSSFSRPRSAQFNGRYEFLLQTISQQGLRTIDLRPALSKPNSFMATDTHWSPEGARSVAHEIAKSVHKDFQFDAHFDSQLSGTKTFDGDLLAFADTGMWRSFLGPKYEQINTFETQSSGEDQLSLFDDVSTPIALVGTSFSARDDFHFVGFLKSALRADVVSLAMEGLGPFHPMQVFLDGNSFSEINPTIVIWEIPERYINTWSKDQ